MHDIMLADFFVCHGYAILPAKFGLDLFSRCREKGVFVFSRKTIWRPNHVTCDVIITIKMFYRQIPPYGENLISIGPIIAEKIFFKGN